MTTVKSLSRLQYTIWCVRMKVWCHIQTYAFVFQQCSGYNLQVFSSAKSNSQQDHAKTTKTSSTNLVKRIQKGRTHSTLLWIWISLFKIVWGMALSLFASVCLIIRIFCHYVTENNISCDSNTGFCCKFSDSHVILSRHPASQAEVFRRWVRSSVQNLTLRAVHVRGCRSVCNLVPSYELHRPAASSERTHLPSARVSPLWTLHTATPAASKTTLY